MLYAPYNYSRPSLFDLVLYLANTFLGFRRLCSFRILLLLFDIFLKNVLNFWAYHFVQRKIEVKKKSNGKNCAKITTIMNEQTSNLA